MIIPGFPAPVMMAGGGAELVSSAGTTGPVQSMALPEHEAGDLIIIGASRLSTGVASVPAGWTAIQSASVNVSGGRSVIAAYKIASTNADTSGTWTNAYGLACAVFRGGVVGAGAIRQVAATTTTGTFSAIASVASRSLILGISGLPGFALMESDPLGMERIASDQMAVTSAYVSSFASRTFSQGNSADISISIAIEAAT